jgi:hypothetical protein
MIDIMAISDAFAAIKDLMDKLDKSLDMFKSLC